MKTSVRITKCYLVEYIDDNGKELCSDFCFGTKKDAEEVGERLKKEYVEMKPCDGVLLGA